MYITGTVNIFFQFTYRNIDFSNGKILNLKKSRKTHQKSYYQQSILIVLKNNFLLAQKMCSALKKIVSALAPLPTVPLRFCLDT